MVVDQIKPHSSVLRSAMTGICSLYISDSDWCLNMLLYVHARFSYHNILLSIFFNSLASFSVLTLSGLFTLCNFSQPRFCLAVRISWYTLRLECECVGKKTVTTGLLVWSRGSEMGGDTDGDIYLFAQHFSLLAPEPVFSRSEMTND